MVDYAERLRNALGGGTPEQMRNLAKHLGISYQAVKQVADGVTRFFVVPNHIRACQFLGVRSEWLGLGEGPMREPGREASLPDAVDYRTLALMIIAEHPDVAARDLMLQLIDLVDIKAAQLRQVAGQRAIAHTPQGG